MNLTSKQKSELKVVLAKVNEILGPNGENWNKGRKDICLARAVAKTFKEIDTDLGAMIREIAEVISSEHGITCSPNIRQGEFLELRQDTGVVVKFNDEPRTTWQDIKNVLDKVEERLA